MAAAEALAALVRDPGERACGLQRMHSAHEGILRASEHGAAEADDGSVEDDEAKAALGLAELLRSDSPDKVSLPLTHNPDLRFFSWRLLLTRSTGLMRR